MKRCRKNTLKSSSGITLIALVVTIVVLLILAGVSIGMLTGENGILKQASEAKKQTETASKNEKYDLSKIEDLMNESQTGIVVEQVTDINPGVLEGTGTEENPYVINSIEDLVFFAYDVTNGNNYNDQTVTLGLSLDFNSSKSYVDPFRTDYGKYGYDGELKTLLTTEEGFKSIGITTEDDETKNFVGTFDGNENSIYNLYINVNNRDTDIEWEKRGLFANNFGTICNLKLVNVNLYLNSNGGYLGGISGQNSKSGNILNCIVTGKIKQESKSGGTGGITCYSSGSIKMCTNMADIDVLFDMGERNCLGGICSAGGMSGEIAYCYNTGTIVGNGKNIDVFQVGGIAGSLAIEKSVSNCYNIGNVTAYNENGYLYLGGIVGVTSSINMISNCYNTGEVKGKAKNLKIGGIVGYFNSNSNIEYCYNIGKVSGNGSEKLYMGKIVGLKYVTDSTITYSYYKKDDAITGIGSEDDLYNDMAKTEDEMKSESFVDLLNEYNDNKWKADTSNINNGYPILNWQQ